VVLERDGEDQLDRPCEKEEALHRVKEERNILHTVRRRRKANWICCIWLGNCLLRDAIEGKIKGRIEVMGIRGRKRKQLLSDLEKRRGSWKLNETALNRNLSLWKRLWACRETDYGTNDFHFYCCNFFILRVAFDEGLIVVAIQCS